MFKTLTSSLIGGIVGALIMSQSGMYLKVRGLEVIDSKGRPRIRLGFDTQSSDGSWFDRSTLQTGLGYNATLHFIDEQGFSRMVLGSIHYAHLGMALLKDFGRPGKPALGESLYIEGPSDESKRGEIFLGNGPGGNFRITADQTSAKLWISGRDYDDLGVHHSGISIDASEGRGVLSITQEGEATSLSLGEIAQSMLTPKGEILTREMPNAGILIKDSSGKPLWVAPPVPSPRWSRWIVYQKPHPKSAQKSK